MPPRDPGRASFRLSRWLCLRAVGVVSGVAFGSLGVQVLGLMGSRGIEPAAETLALYARWFEGARFWRAPTLFWLDASDATLVTACVLGALLSLVLVCGLAPRLLLVLLAVLYLSLVTVSGVFLGYQWDALLVETLLIAALLAPPGWREHPRTDPPPPRAALWLQRVALFKLMFLSGWVKLASGDPTWRDLTALEYHYWTQPLPAWTSLLVAGLPPLFHRLSVLATFVVELAVPFGLFVPGWPRRLAALALIGFQALLAATGNFAFFNLLTISLTLPALDDALLARLLPRGLRERLGAAETPAPPPRRALPAALAGALLLLNAGVLAQRLLPPGALPGPPADLLRAIAPFEVVNGYGLFAVMTTERPEILVEGSRDGRSWRAYAFRWKPGPLDRRPGFVAPHQPRLDWQLWFAALRGCRRATWFARFAERLLQGSPPVLALLAHDPFPDAPPRYLRTRVQRYRPTDAATRRRTGRWWEREEPGRPYCPVFTLEDGHLAVASPE